MPFFSSVDRKLLLAVGLVIGIGIIVLSSASSVFAFERYGDSYYFVKRQILYGILPGVVFSVIVFSLPSTRIQAMIPALFYGSLLLLVAVFLPGIGEHLGRAQRWIRMGNVLLQPSEFVKLTSILYCARLFSQSSRCTQAEYGWRRVLAMVWPLLIVGGMVMLQPDMGTTVVIVVTLMGMLFLSGIPWRPLALLCLAGLIAVAILVATSPYRRERVLTYLYPSTDVQGQGYHVNQALIGVASGGVWGQGIGRSVQKFQYLPEVASDSLFAIMAEELGFVIVSLILLLLGWVVARCFRIAERIHHDPFASYVCAGIGIWLGTQTLINISANIGLLPFTGVPLPFLSHGGTSMVVLIVSMTLVAILADTPTDCIPRSRRNVLMRSLEARL